MCGNVWSLRRCDARTLSEAQVDDLWASFKEPEPPRNPSSVSAPERKKIKITQVYEFAKERVV
jgi:hypothetical protein